MGLTLLAGANLPTTVFVETIIPDGVDAIRAGGIEYVETVETADDLPEWADAVRDGRRVFVKTAST